MSDKKEDKKLQILAYFTPEQLKAIEDYQFENRIKSRNEAIRQLLDKGIENTK